jgi:hypothetical protein
MKLTDGSCTKRRWYLKDFSAEMDTEAKHPLLSSSVPIRIYFLISVITEDQATYLHIRKDL